MWEADVAGVLQVHPSADNLPCPLPRMERCAEVVIWESSSHDGVSAALRESLFPVEWEFLSLRSYKLAGMLNIAFIFLVSRLGSQYFLLWLFLHPGKIVLLILVPRSQQEVCLASSLVKYLGTPHAQPRACSSGGEFSLFMSNYCRMWGEGQWLLPSSYFDFPLTSERLHLQFLLRGMLNKVWFLVLGWTI